MPGDGRRVRRRAVTAKPKPTGRPHLFVPDPDVPADHNGRGACVTCHLGGEPGDAHHQLPDVPEQAVVAARYEHEEN
jgi:hypothetical protein